MSDDLSCSVFGLVVFVTASYYYLLVNGEIKDDKKVNASYTFFLLLMRNVQPKIQI